MPIFIRCIQISGTIRIQIYFMMLSGEMELIDVDWLDVVIATNMKEKERLRSVPGGWVESSDWWIWEAN